MKKLLTFLMFFLLATIAAQAETQTITIDKLIVDSKDNKVRVSCAKGTGSNGPVIQTNGFVRLYAKNTVTIYSEVNFTKLKIGWSNNTSNPYASASSNTGNYTDPASDGSNIVYGIWTGNANEVVFTIGDTGQKQIHSVEVTYDDGGDTPTPTPYTVTLSDDNSTLTETSAGEGVTLPTRSDVGEWKFEGWSETNVTTQTTTAPTIISAGNYKPTANITLYPVYSKTEGEGGTATKESGLTASTSAQNLVSDKPITYKMSAKNNYSDPLRVYQNNILTIECTSTDKITKIVLSGTDGSYKTTNLALNTGQTGSITKQETTPYTVIWTGSSSKVEFKASTQARVAKIEVTYGNQTTYYISTPTEPEEKTLIGIEATGTPAEFWKGDAFNHNGITVTATWEDETKTDVTSSCEFSGYDMNTAGEQTVTVTYQGQTATYGIEVKTIANTQETAYTVAEAKALIDAGKDLATKVYVKGTVSKIDSFNETYGSITYWISEEGTTTNQFEVCGGLALSEAKFSAKEDLTVGDDVIVYGTIKDYNGTYEFDVNNYLVKWDKVATLSIADITVELNEDIVPVITTNVTGEYLIKYVSNNEEVVLATDDEMVTKGLGTTTITATLVADGYKTAETTFTVTVAAKTYAINIAENIENGSVEASATRAAAGATVTLTATPADGYKFGAWSVTNATTSEAITVTDNKFTMPAANVNVSATFVAKENYEIAWFVNGAELEEETKQYTEGSSITAPENPKNIADYKFVGWAKNKYEEVSSTDIVDMASETATDNARYYAVFAKATQGNSQTVTLTNAEIISLNNNKTAYTEEQTYTKENITYSIYAYTDQPQRHWLQLKNDKKVYVKITAPKAITKVNVTLTSTTNSKDGINDITKHTAFSGTVALVKNDCNYTTTSESVASTSEINNNIATLLPTGDNKSLYLKVNSGARIWEITTTYTEPTTYSDYTTIVNVQDREFYLNHTWGGTDTWWNKLIPTGNGTYSLNAVCGDSYNDITVGSNYKQAQQSRYLKEDNVIPTDQWNLESKETVGEVSGETCTFAYNPVGNVLTIVSKDVTYYIKNRWKSETTDNGSDPYTWRPLNRANPDGTFSTTGYRGYGDYYWGTNNTGDGTKIEPVLEGNPGPQDECTYTFDYNSGNPTLTIKKNSIITGVEDVEVAGSAVKAYKVIENGQVIIVRGDQRFNIMGQPVR